MVSNSNIYHYQLRRSFCQCIRDHIHHLQRQSLQQKQTTTKNTVNFCWTWKMLSIICSLKSAGLYVTGQFKPMVWVYGIKFAPWPWYTHCPFAKMYTWSNISKILAEGVCTEQMTVRPPCAMRRSRDTHCEQDKSSKPLKWKWAKILIESWVMWVASMKKHTHDFRLTWTYVVGSSRKITGGLFTSSNAIDNRFNSPPDNEWPIVSAAFVNLNKSRISSIYTIKKHEQRLKAMITTKGCLLFNKMFK